jgi:hypothetical protein
MGFLTVKRTNKIEVFLSDYEYEFITEMARKEKLKYSEYIRIAIICDAVLGGNKKAIKYTLKNASTMGKEFVRKKVAYLGQAFLGTTYL